MLQTLKVKWKLLDKIPLVAGGHCRFSEMESYYENVFQSSKRQCSRGHSNCVLWLTA